MLVLVASVVAVVVAALIGLGDRPPAPSPSAASSAAHEVRARPEPTTAAPPVTQAGPSLDAPGGDRGSDRDSDSDSDSDSNEDHTTVFDDTDPTVANLDPALLAALRQAATDAADDGITFVVTSGWRSTELQARLLREAVVRYGSPEEAARWVATPETSLHVSGDAVDLGPAGATAWLARNGSAYGLCPVYANEPWHYELRPAAAAHGCPVLYPDPTYDPRLQQ